jgi:hypothetical protein
MQGLAALAATALTAFVAAGTASATTVETGGTPQNKTVAFTASAKSGTSVAFKDTTGNTADTCTSSEFNGDTVSPFTNTSGVNATLLEFYFTNCTSGKTTVHKPGKLSFEWTKNTEGTVRSIEAEITVYDNIFGGFTTCKTGTTIIGTVTGVATGQATLHVNAVLSCTAVSSLKWEGTYVFTSPNGFGLVQ